MAARKFTATTPDGSHVRIRTSERPYAFASWVQFPDAGQQIVAFHLTEASAHKTYGGQTGAQVRWFKSLPHGVVPVAVAS